jgi:hypothetical protein
VLASYTTKIDDIVCGWKEIEIVSMMLIGSTDSVAAWKASVVVAKGQSHDTTPLPFSSTLRRFGRSAAPVAQGF